MPTSPDTVLPPYEPTLDPVTTARGALDHAALCARVSADDARTARRRACEHADALAGTPGASSGLRARCDAAAARAADYAARAARAAHDAAEARRAGLAALDAGELEYAGRCAGLAADYADAAYAAAHGAEEAEDDARELARLARRRVE